MLIMFERLFPLFLFLQTTPTPTHPPCARDGVHFFFFFWYSSSFLVCPLLLSAGVLACADLYVGMCFTGDASLFKGRHVPTYLDERVLKKTRKCTEEDSVTRVL